MRNCHSRCRPEREEPAHVQRMANVTVCRWCFEGQRLVRSVEQLQPYLAETKQVEMIDHESRGEHETPTESAGGVEDEPPDIRIDIPDYSAYRLPECKQDDERNTRKQCVRAALGR